MDMKFTNSNIFEKVFDKSGLSFAVENRTKSDNVCTSEKLYDSIPGWPHWGLYGPVAL